MATRSGPVAILDDPVAIRVRANQKAASAQAWREQDEARQQPYAPLNFPNRYVVRSKPGTQRGWSVKIPQKLTDQFAYENTKHAERLDRDFEKRRRAWDGTDQPKYDLEKVREAVGDTIQFTSMPGGPNQQGYCFFVTDNEDVYQFLRHCQKMDTSPMRSWNDFVFEYPQRIIEVEGRKVPRTAAGLASLQEELLAPDDGTEE